MTNCFNEIQRERTDEYNILNSERNDNRCCISSNDIITTHWYFKLLPRNELEYLILEAAEKSSINQFGKGRMFSTNDLYLNITIGNLSVFKTAQKGTIWEDRFNLISLGIVQYTLKSNGYSSIKRGGGVNVRRWYKEELFLEEEKLQKSEIIDADKKQEEALELEIKERFSCRNTSALIEIM